MGNTKDEEDTIAYRIKTIRTYKNLTQEDLAELAGYNDKSSISKIENSGNDISLKKVNRIAKALGVSPSELLSDTADFRANGLAGTATKDSQNFPPEFKKIINTFGNALSDYKKNQDEIRRLINESNEKERYRDFIKDFNEGISLIESYTNRLDELFDKLKKVLKVD